MCATTDAIAPARQPDVWASPQPVISQPPAPVVGNPAPLASQAPAPSAAPVATPVNIQTAQKQVRSAWRWLLIVGIMYVVLGVLSDIGYMGDIESLFGGWGLAVGATFLVLAFFVRQGYLAAMVIAIAVYTAYTLAFFAAGSYAFLRILVLAWLLRALLSMYTVRKHLQAQAQHPPASDQTRAA